MLWLMGRMIAAEESSSTSQDNDQPEE